MLSKRRRPPPVPDAARVDPLPVEAAVVMVHSASPGAMPPASRPRASDTIVFRRLHARTRHPYEVRTGVLEFQSAAAARPGSMRFEAPKLTSDGFAAYFDD